ncbi:4'-phosphopantetheinyl transferase superfamily protein [Starkeya sp. ORNL1]|uniref:4'-phosphopantetheinyl transferase family protein n=1 Tax=Starkeya sp. ORNL1 TaxID=2709380 RepID=UPI001463236A|nr:4'-phosphopantetheinyl transferase superfamily protein [Starkeya sp. ORNL1]QJP15770.1 4'-phosphopantetheinyl transferase superfamily protein [Starkeya sp. ORNL1]
MDARDRGEAIEIWRIALDEIDLATATEVLDLGEISRADSFATPLLRRRFLSRRMALRQILACRLGIAPARVALELSAQGKPRLVDRPGLFFNVSHSGALGLLALSTRSELGIDIEMVRDVPRWTEIVREFFAETEREALLRSDRTVSTFLAFWTRKEAVAKATGLGLDLPLSSFTVAKLVGAESSAVTIRGLRGAARTWHVRDLMSGPEHIAALASSSAYAEIKWKSFPVFGER